MSNNKSENEIENNGESESAGEVEDGERTGGNVSTILGPSGFTANTDYADYKDEYNEREGENRE